MNESNPRTNPDQQVAANVSDEVPQPPIKKRCARCLSVDPVWLLDATPGVVSPSGVEHIGNDDAVTACGIDATPDGWWWPL